MGQTIGTSGEKGEKGGKWTFRLYLDRDSSDRNVPLEKISDDELRERMSELINTEENILSISIYMHPLDMSPNKDRLPDHILCHQLVGFETERWWWSIEKNLEGISIQRGRNLDDVRDRYRMKNRPTPVTQIIKDDGQYNMQDLVNFLYENDELNKEYYWSGDNCKDFAARIFAEFVM